MRSAATELLAATPAAEQAQLAFNFDDSLRSDWHYTPRRRAGLAFKDMSKPQRRAARALLRVPQNYAVAVYGTPAGDGDWGRDVLAEHYRRGRQVR